LAFQQLPRRERWEHTWGGAQREKRKKIEEQQGIEHGGGQFSAKGRSEKGITVSAESVVRRATRFGGFVRYLDYSHQESMWGAAAGLLDEIG